MRWAVVAALLIAATAAGAAEKPNRGEWFKSLRQPGTKISCCDVSDCKLTVARYANGSWWARMPDEHGPEVYVPPDKVLTEPKSIDGEAYICSTSPFPGGWQYYPFGGGPVPRYYSSPIEARILCFIPPIYGY